VLRQAAVAVALATVVVVCLRMGWWQLERYLSAGGSLQNLGYTLQWPTFAVFAVVAWWRLRALERARAAAAEAAAADDPDGGQVDDAAGPGSHHTGGPDEPDDELAAYNRYLAGLNAAAERKKS
jgi:hypothetical protein